MDEAGTPTPPLPITSDSGNSSTTGDANTSADRDAEPLLDPADPLLEGGSDGAPDSSTADVVETSTAQARIGAGGGTLSAAGIAVIIPPDALSEALTLTLTVSDDGDVTVAPDTFFSRPVTVRMDSTRWPYRGPRIAQHRRDGVYSMIGEVAKNSEASWSYETIEFSTTRASELPCVINAGKLKCCRRGDDNPSSWTVGDCWGTYSEAAEEAPTAETTTIPTTTARASISPTCCLRDASDVIGTRFSAATCFPTGSRRVADEAKYMTAEALDALQRAQVALRAVLPSYDVWVNAAFDSSGGCHGPIREGRRGSFHYYGAALDLSLYDGKKVVTDAALLGQLPALLVRSGFTWVWYEDGAHVHASISSPSLQTCVTSSLNINGSYEATPAAKGINKYCSEEVYDPLFCYSDGQTCYEGWYRYASLSVSGEAGKPSMSWQGYSVIDACRRGDTVSGFWANEMYPFEATFTESGVSGWITEQNSGPSGICGERKRVDFTMPKTNASP
jgi:Hedgehog amino-terminal signalling domain